MISLPIFAVFIATLGIIWWMKQKETNGKFKPIPGPWGLPILGHVLQLDKALHKPFAKWADKYGKIFKLKFGQRTVIVVSDPKWIRELFSQDFMAGRQFFEGLELYENEQLGIASSEGDLWEVHRRFMLRNLRDFGFGKSSMGDKITGEVEEFLEKLKIDEGKPIEDIKKRVLIAIENSLWSVTGSQRFEQDDPVHKKHHEDIKRFIEDSAKYTITFFIPWTRFILPKIKYIADLRRDSKKFYGDIIQQHEDTLREDEPARDFIDLYLLEMKANKDNPQSQFYGDKARRQLIVTLADLMFAGTDSTSGSLQFALLYLTKFQEVQRKLQDEIKTTTNNSRLVNADDLPKMQYTLAVLEEILRFLSLAATGLPRRATTTREFKGYLIPENAWVFPNLHYLHHSKEIWGDPENFRPERFLAEGKFKKNEVLMAFSTGRRQCPGESLARLSLLLFMTNIFQRFSTKFDPSKEEPELEPKWGIASVSPCDFSVIFTDRLTQ